MIIKIVKVILGRKDAQIFLICVATGGTLQILAKRYIKNHPRLLEDELVTKKRYRLPKFISPRGGAVFEVTGINANILIKITLNYLAKKGFLTGVIAGTGFVASKIPLDAASTYLRDAFPQNLPHLEKKKFILVNGEKIYLDYCDQSLGYLFNILGDKTIPFEEKEKLARSILTKYLNLKTASGRINFIICIGFILYIFSIQNQASFYILLNNLIQAIKDGKITKEMARLIIRRLQRRGVPIDPELIEIANS